MRLLGVLLTSASALRVTVITWNAGSTAFNSWNPYTWKALAGNAMAADPDLIVIALQETETTTHSFMVPGGVQWSVTEFAPLMDEIQAWNAKKADGRQAEMLLADQMPKTSAKAYGMGATGILVISPKTGRHGVAVDTKIVHTHRNGMKEAANKGGASVRIRMGGKSICVSSVHLSMAGTPIDRRETLEDIIEEAEWAFMKEGGCDEHIIAGDLNSRLACTDPADPETYRKLADAITPATGYMQYCTAANADWSTENEVPQPRDCDLSGSPWRDELYSILNGTRAVCATKKAHEVLEKDAHAATPVFDFKTTTTVEAGVFSFSFMKKAEAPAPKKFQATQYKEVAAVRFPPTYKRAPPPPLPLPNVKGEPAGSDTVIWKNEETDELESWNHNPSWTDRILVRTTTKFRTEAYGALQQFQLSGDSDKKWGTAAKASDHIPVAAVLDLE